jgi:hypothetical protein
VTAQEVAPSSLFLVPKFVSQKKETENYPVLVLLVFNLKCFFDLQTYKKNH